jgi:hypothetical protein
MNAKAGESVTKPSKFSRLEILEVIRVWRQQTMPTAHEEKLLARVYRPQLIEAGFPLSKILS